jgi:hypothetical protein
VKIKQSPLDRHELAAGRHTVEIVNPYARQRRKRHRVVIEPGQVSRIHEQLSIEEGP